LSTIIKKSDEIYDSQKAFNLLDSINKKAKLNEKTQVLLYEKLAQRALELTNYGKLTEVCVKGIDLAQKNKLDSAEAFFYKFIGFSQSYNQKLKESIVSFRKSAEIANRANLKILEATNYNNIGGNSIDLKEFDQAEFYLKKSIALSEKNGFPSLRNKLLSYRLLATLYERTNRLHLCEPIYVSLEKSSFELKDTNLICSNLVFYGNFLRDQKKIKKAKEKLKIAIDLTKKYGDKHSIQTALLFYKAILYEEGNFKEAYMVYNEIFELERKIYLEENQNQINQFETQLRTKEISQAKETAEAKALAEQRKKNNYLLILLFVVIVAIGIFVIIYLRNARKAAQIKLLFQEEKLASIIEGQENERTRIAKELHDGIVQDLTVLKMNLSEVNEKSELDSKLTKITKELRELSYQMMPISLKELGLIPALEDLFERSFTKNGISFDFEAFLSEVRLDEKIEVNIYRICQELINNTLKHANATEINIVLRKKDKLLSLIFEDNGQGFDVSTAKSGIGLTSLKTRLEAIHGEIEYDSVINQGTTAYIKIFLS
jgi:signal transduction histidine kinase